MSIVDCMSCFGQTCSKLLHQTMDTLSFDKGSEIGIRVQDFQWPEAHAAAMNAFIKKRADRSLLWLVGLRRASGLRVFWVVSMSHCP